MFYYVCCVDRHNFCHQIFEHLAVCAQTTCKHAKPSSFSSRTFYRRCFAKDHEKSFPLFDNGGYSHRSTFESWQTERVWSACAHEDSFLMRTLICARLWVARVKKKNPASERMPDCLGNYIHRIEETTSVYGMGAYRENS